MNLSRRQTLKGLLMAGAATLLPIPALSNWKNPYYGANEFLFDFSKSFDHEILSRMSPNPWLKLIQTDYWDAKAEETLKCVTFSQFVPNTLGPVTEPNWSGKSFHSIDLSMTALESGSFPLYPFESNRSLKARAQPVIASLANSTEFLLSEKTRSDFDNVCRHEETPALTKDFLIDQYSYLVHIGGSDSRWLKTDHGVPIFPLVTSEETAKRLGKVYGFEIFVDSHPVRTDVSGKRLWEYKRIPTEHGYKLELNGSYFNAPQEDSFIVHPEAVKQLCLPTLSEQRKPTNENAFQKVVYAGSWRWCNIRHQTDNPKGDHGFFRGIFNLACEPLYTDFGVRIRHGRT